MSFIIRLENLPASADSADIRRFFGRIDIPDGGIFIIGGARGIAFISLRHEYDVKEAFLLNDLLLHKNHIRLFFSSNAELEENIARVQRELMEESRGIPHDIDPQDRHLFIEREHRRKLYREGMHEKLPGRDVRRRSPHMGDRRRSPVRDIRRRSPVRDYRRSPRRNSRNSPEPFVHRRTPDRIIRQKSPERLGVSSRRRSRSPIKYRNRSRSADRNFFEKDLVRKVSPHRTLNEQFPVEIFDPKIMQNVKPNLESDVKFMTTSELQGRQLPEQSVFINHPPDPALPMRVNEYADFPKHSEFPNVMTARVGNALTDTEKVQPIPFIDELGCFPEAQRQDHNQPQILDKMTKLPHDRHFIENYVPDAYSNKQERLPRFEDPSDRFIDSRERFPDYHDKFLSPFERFQHPREKIPNLERFLDFPGRTMDPARFTNFPEDKRKSDFFFQDREIGFGGFQRYEEMHPPPQKRAPNYCVMLSGFNQKDNYKDVQQVLKNVYAPQKNIKWETNQGCKTGVVYVKICNEDDFYAVLRTPVLRLKEKRIEVAKCPDEIFWEMFQHDSYMEYDDEPIDLVCLLKGLPYSTTENEIMRFFRDLKLSDLVILYDTDGKATGSGYVEFDNLEDYKRAFERNGKKIYNRYIEISPSCREDVAEAKKFAVAVSDPFKVDKQQSAFFESSVLRQPTAVRPLCAMLSGLPPNILNSQIYDFFAESDVQPQAVHILIFNVQRPIGRAYAEFYDPFEFDIALKQHGKSIEDCTISVKQVLFEEMMNVLETHEALHLYTNKTAIKRYSSPVPEKVPYLWEPPDETEKSKFKSSRTAGDSFKSRLFNKMAHDRDNSNYPKYPTVSSETKKIQVFDYAHCEKEPIAMNQSSGFVTKSSVGGYENAYSERNKQRFNERSEYLQNTNLEFGYDPKYFSHDVQNFDSRADSFKTRASTTSENFKFSEARKKDSDEYQNSRNRNYRSNAGQPEHGNVSSSISSNAPSSQHLKHKEHASTTFQKPDSLKTRASAASDNFKFSEVEKKDSVGINQNSRNQNSPNSGQSKQSNVLSKGLSNVPSFQHPKSEESVTTMSERSIPKVVDTRGKDGVKEDSVKEKQESVSSVKIGNGKQIENDNPSKKKKYEKSDSDRKDRITHEKKTETTKRVDKTNEIPADKVNKDSQQVSDKKKSGSNNKNENKKNESSKDKDKKEISYVRIVERKSRRSRSRERYRKSGAEITDTDATFSRSKCIVHATDVHPHAGLAELLDFFRSFDLSSDDIVRRFTDTGFPTSDIRISFRNFQEAKRAIRDLNFRKIRDYPIKMFLV